MNDETEFSFPARGKIDFDETTGEISGYIDFTINGKSYRFEPETPQSEKDAAIEAALEASKQQRDFLLDTHSKLLEQQQNVLRSLSAISDPRNAINEAVQKHNQWDAD